MTKLKKFIVTIVCSVCANIATAEGTETLFEHNNISRIPSTVPHYSVRFKDVAEWQVKAGETVTITVLYSGDRVATGAIYSVHTMDELIGNFSGRSGFVEKTITRTTDRIWLFHLSATGDVYYLSAALWDLSKPFFN